MSKSTAYEALTAELLGDVGVVHDMIKALPEKLAVVSRELEERTGALIEAESRLISSINSFVAKKANATAAKCVADVESQIRGLVNGAIQESLGSPLAQTISHIKSVTNEAQKSIKATESYVQKVTNSTLWATTFYATAAGIFGGLISASIILIFFK